MELNRQTHLTGTIQVPGDKSISHRCVMLGSIARGMTEIHHFLQSADCIATINCFQELGIKIEEKEDSLLVHGKGLYGLTAPKQTLQACNSGTTIRLLSGILAGQPFSSRLSGDDSLNARPMKRILDPLQQMGAHIESEKHNDCAPLTVSEAALHGIRYTSPLSSAQVKSCLLLAGLYAQGETAVTEPYLSRNHTELLLKEMGADITSETSENLTAAATLKPGNPLEGISVTVPGDISSAAYFIAAGLLVPHSEILIQNVGINPTRAGILKVAKEMGGDITCLNERREGGEPVGDLLVRTSSLHGVTIGGANIPTLIDEIPIIAVMAAFAEGPTIIQDAAELKVKETNRIETISRNLTAMGGDVTPTDDGLIIEGGKSLHGAVIQPQGDHRIAMAFSIAALLTDQPTTILDSSCVDVSYPSFYDTLRSLSD